MTRFSFETLSFRIYLKHFTAQYIRVNRVINIKMKTQKTRRQNCFSSSSCPLQIAIDSLKNKFELFP